MAKSLSQALTRHLVDLTLEQMSEFSSALRLERTKAMLAVKKVREQRAMAALDPIHSADIIAQLPELTPRQIAKLKKLLDKTPTSKHAPQGLLPMSRIDDWEVGEDGHASENRLSKNNQTTNPSTKK